MQYQEEVTIRGIVISEISGDENHAWFTIQCVGQDALKGHVQVHAYGQNARRVQHLLETGNRVVVGALNFKVAAFETVTPDGSTITGGLIVRAKTISHVVTVHRVTVTHDVTGFPEPPVL